MKDPVIIRDERGWRAWICCHPLDDPDATDRMWTEFATSDDGIEWTMHGPALAAQPGAVGRAGHAGHRHHPSAARPLSRSTTGAPDAAENWEERTGVAEGRPAASRGGGRRTGCASVRRVPGAPLRQPWSMTAIAPPCTTRSGATTAATSCAASGSRGRPDAERPVICDLAPNVAIGEPLVTVVLAPVDAVDVTLVMDLSLDILMSGQDGVQRFKLAYDWSDHDSLLAEHGFSALITVTVNGTRQAVLYDGGLSPLALQHNLDVMQINVTNLRAITISHGHVDHHGGLEGLFRRHGALRLPLIIHPDAWKDRKVVMPTGAELHLPPPNHNDLEREGLTVIEERGPTLLIDGTVLVSGQVARVTSYEKGYPIQVARSGCWRGVGARSLDMGRSEPGRECA